MAGEKRARTALNLASLYFKTYKNYLELGKVCRKYAPPRKVRKKYVSDPYHVIIHTAGDESSFTKGAPLWGY